MKQLSYLLCMGIMFFSACQSTSTVSKTDPKTAVTVESEKANTFFEEAFEESLARSPMFQSYLGKWAIFQMNRL